jgi:flagellar biosynthetic protein FlhB
LDYGFQWWKHERDLRMTTQEVREELKNLEANPQMVARRKQVQRELALHRISSAVPKADAVITSPAEQAIALRYDPRAMAAPVVVAKGAGPIAARIRKLASEHGIPLFERKPLAQALYREVEIDRPIPQARYAAVAEALAEVYQLKGKKIAMAGKS